jgi:5-formyltetrahydrofolate cyclo-ligase
MTVHTAPLEPNDAKVELRASIRRQRQQRAERRLQEHAAALCERVLEFEPIRDARCVSVYASRPHEPGTLPLIEALSARGVRVLIPLLGDGLQRGWGVYGGAADLLERAPGRPPEPSTEFLPPAAVADADVVIVPALAVDTTGTRLGQGGGWYDRALADVREGVPIIALTFAGEVRDGSQEPLPREHHDVRVHGVFTPEGYTALPQ